MISLRCGLVGALAAAVSGLTAILPAHAAQPKKHHAAAPPAAEAAPAARSLGQFDAWTAYASHDKTGKVCYLVGQPQKSEPAGAARKAPTAMVTHRPVEKAIDVVSFVAGYALKERSKVALDIGGKKFELFTRGDGSWAETADLDKTIVATLAKSKQVVVKGVPRRGPMTTDIYLLDGFAKALALIDKACGVQR